MDFLDAARQFIAIDTSPENGTNEAALWLKEMIEDQDFDILIQEDTFNGIEQANIIVTPKAEFFENLNNKNNIEDFILQSHIDTVNPGSAVLWQENHLNPFNLIIKDGYLFGLGVADSKLDFLCKYEALKKFQNHKNWKRRPVLIGTYGEEIGMHGMLRFIRKNKINAKMALIGEATGLNLNFASKGHAVIEIKIPFSEEEKRYREQHDMSESSTTQSRLFNSKRDSSESGSPNFESAIDKIFNYLLQIPDGVVLMEVDAGVSYNATPLHGVLELDLVSGVQDAMVRKLKLLYYQIVELKGEFLAYQDPEFNPPNPLLHIGMIKTNSDHVTVTLNCRFPPIVTESNYQQWLNRLQNVSEKIQGQARVIDYKRPYHTDLRSEFVKNCEQVLEKVGLNKNLKTQSHTNEASLLSRVGVECLGFGPGVREGNVHTPNEKVKLDDIYKSIEFYQNAIEAFCLSH